MSRRRGTNPALGDALRQAFGYPETNEAAPTNSKEQSRHEPRTDEDSDTASASLARLYQALASSSVNGVKASSLLVPLAIDVARNGLLAKTRDSEAHVVASLIHKMGEDLLNGAPGRAERSDLVLAMACLSGGKGNSGEIKKNFTRILALAVLADRLPDDFVESIARNTKEKRLLKSTVALDTVNETVRIERAKAEQFREQEIARLKAIEETRRSAILEIRQRVSRIRSELLSVDVPPEIEVDPLRAGDILLVLKWGNQAKDNGVHLTHEIAHNRLGSWEFTRLCSARSAELASAKFYEGLGATVQDVSVKQLDPRNSDWKTHDLMVDSLPIDVKNARQSFSDPTRYSEYLVPAFKQERHSGHGVTIVAVLSRYMIAAQILDGTNAECTVLGEVTQVDLDQLARWVNSSFNGVLAARNFSAGRRLPGWCFEYQWRKKLATTKVAHEIKELLHEIRQKSLTLDEVELPHMFVSFVDGKEMTRTLLGEGQLTSPNEQDFHLWESLSAMQFSIGWSRRTLFLFVIGYTLEQVKAGVEDWTPGRFNKWLFIDNTSRAKYWPLGLYDPLGYVAGIVSAMDTLWASSRKLLKGFVSFRMTSPWILLGADGSGNEVTIMAYCGGWIETRKAKCGLSPLVIGIDRSCPHCKKLICHKCDFCSDGCARMVNSATTTRNIR